MLLPRVRHRRGLADGVDGDRVVIRKVHQDPAHVAVEELHHLRLLTDGDQAVVHRRYAHQLGLIGVGGLDIASTSAMAWERLLPFATSWFGTELIPVFPPDRTSAAACTYCENPRIISRNCWAASPRQTAPSPPRQRWPGRPVAGPPSPERAGSRARHCPPATDLPGH